MKATISRLRELLEYDALTGSLRWRINRRGTARAGTIAGRTVHTGYREISISRQAHLAHRVAWAMFHGAWPSLDIDHINLDRQDNRIANLRQATDSQNKANARRQANSTSGFKGVTWHKRLSKWQAAITIGRKTKYLGVFETAEEAHATYQQAAKENFGEFARYE